MGRKLIHLLIGLICLGLALYFWERFPAFKWIVASVVGAIALVIILLFMQASERKKKERLGFEWSEMRVVMIDSPGERWSNQSPFLRGSQI
jgi:DMSO/TMAO reductase YedYZ heme-binding membrane subunit